MFVQSKDRAQELFNELIYDGMNVDVTHSERPQTQVRYMFVKYAIFFFLLPISYTRTHGHETFHTNKTVRHDITEIFLKMVLNTITLTHKTFNYIFLTHAPKSSNQNTFYWIGCSVTHDGVSSVFPRCNISLKGSMREV